MQRSRRRARRRWRSPKERCSFSRRDDMSAMQAAMLKALHEGAALAQLIPSLHAARHPKLTAA
jgi:hypothetical protein